MFSKLLPCGSWQFAALDHRRVLPEERPALLGVAPIVIGVERGLPQGANWTVPCGLWQELHDIFPSRSGMWEERSCFARACWRWQVAHVSISVPWASWARGE
jgi:hypothetical protein